MHYIAGTSEFVIITALVSKTPYIPDICKEIMVQDRSQRGVQGVQLNPPPN